MTTSRRKSNGLNEKRSGPLWPARSARAMAGCLTRITPGQKITSESYDMNDPEDPTDSKEEEFKRG